MDRSDGSWKTDKTVFVVQINKKVFKAACKSFKWVKTVSFKKFQTTRVTICFNKDSLNPRRAVTPLSCV